MNQPIYTGGRLNNAYGVQASSLDASKLDLERTRQELEYRVVETFFAALMNERGVRGGRRADSLDTRSNWNWRGRVSMRERWRGSTCSQAEVELANAKARRIQTQAQVDTSLQALRSVLSLPQTQSAEAAWDRSTSR